jgi:murein DD-endopeptidase MepM/ murein hydrolase activator NlpD
VAGYQVPNDAPISSSWSDHRNRNPPSNEPGTDYACGYGSDIAMAEAGYVSVIDTNNGGGEGRRLSVDLDDGRRVSYIHLSSINAYIGQRVERGQVGLCRSGASGYGNDWYYGPHVHVSLWERPGMSYKDTIDFAAHVGPPDPGPDPVPVPRQIGGNMFLIHNASSPEQYIVVSVDGGEIRGRYLEDPYERAVFTAMSPQLPVTACDDPTFNGFLERIGYAYQAPIPLVSVNAADVSWRPDSRAGKLSASLIGLLGVLVFLGVVDVVVAVTHAVGP